MKRLIPIFLLPFVLAALVARAQMPMHPLPLGTHGVSVVPPSWNPSDKSADVTLSGSNLIATQNTTSSAWRMVRSTTSYTVGTSTNKVYFKITATTVDGSGGWIGGFANGAASLSSYVGSGGVALGMQSDTTADKYNSGNTLNANCNVGANFATMWMAINFNNGKVWCDSPGCTLWNASSNGDPGSDSNPAYTIPNATVVFIAWSGFRASGSQDVATLANVPSIGSCTNLTGFSDW